MSNFNWIINAAIIGAIIVGFIIITLGIVVIAKPRIKEQNFKYFYAFSAGFMIVISILGLYGEAKEKISDIFNGRIAGINVIYAILIFIGGIVLSVLALYGIKQLVNPKKDQKISEKKHKWIGLIMIFAHRIPASIVIGLIAIAPEGQGALLLVIAIHIIPEVLILFYRQVEAGYSIKRATLNSLYIKILFFVMILIGACIGKGVQNINWLQSILLIIAGTIMSYGVITELIPEFIGFLNPHHHHAPQCVDNNKGPNLVYSIDHSHEVISVAPKLKKVMIKISIWLIIGLAMAAIILIFE